MFKERRKFPRADIRFKINIICEGKVILGEPQNYIFHSYTENIGEGGIKVILEKGIKVGSFIKLELFITSRKLLPIRCNGIVIWSRRVNPPRTKPDLFNIGIKFIQLITRDQEILGGIVERFLEKKKGIKKHKSSKK